MNSSCHYTEYTPLDIFGWYLLCGFPYLPVRSVRIPIPPREVGEHGVQNSRMPCSPTSRGGMGISLPAVRIPIPPREVGEHGVQNSRIDGCGRLVVKIRWPQLASGFRLRYGEIRGRGGEGGRP